MAQILLVDDDCDLVEVYRVVLAHRGHDVLCACSAAEAEKLLLRARPDVAVLDVMMESDTAGFELARKAHEAQPELPIVILSGIHEATGVPFRFEPDGTWLPVLKFIDKPVKPAKLADEIEAIIAQKK